jgi:hypothetical protein
METSKVTKISAPANAYLVGIRNETGLSSAQRERLLKTAELLRGSMVWADTAEGWDFWASVCDRLINLSKGEPLR